MTHLEDEDIARMIEGKISKKERETFLRHLSECSACFNVYTETLKFVEGEKQGKVPGIEKIKAALQRFRLAAGTIFPNKRLVPAFAVSITIVLVGIFVINYLLHRAIEIENNKTAYIEKTIEEIENRDVHAFSGSKGEIYAALRAGIFIEDLSLVVKAGGKKDLKTKIIKMLGRQLNVFAGEKSTLFPELENIERKNVETVVNRIRELMEKRSRDGLFRFGRFVEHSILAAYENKTPKPEDIEKYRRILQKYEETLPPGVFKELKKLETVSRVEENREIFIAIKEILLE
jgi:hypothetical protein